MLVILIYQPYFSSFGFQSNRFILCRFTSIRIILFEIHPLCGKFISFSLPKISNKCLLIIFFIYFFENVFEIMKFEVLMLKISFSSVVLSAPLRIYSIWTKALHLYLGYNRSWESKSFWIFSASLNMSLREN